MIVDYDYDPLPEQRVAILRHDIDTSIEKACQLAGIEQELGIQSTYFVLITSDFYNVFSKKSYNGLKEIMTCGHTIGLHFDEERYPDIAGDARLCSDRIGQEAKALSEVVGKQITVFSYHRPSKAILQSGLNIMGMTNSYGEKFFHDYKYLSDSRRRWREPVLDIIKSGKYQRLQILTHAFWYHNEEETIHDSIKEFVNNANRERYITFQDNITNLYEIMAAEEVL